MAIESTVRRWHSGVLASAAAAGGVAIASAGLLIPDQSAQAATNVATSTLINLTVDHVPALGLTAFQGTYATSGVPQNGGDDAADTAQDPDGVLKHITVTGPAQSKTHSDAVKNWAQSQLVSAIGTKSPAAPPVAYFMNGKQIYSIGSLDSYAECTLPPTGPYALAYVHTDANAVNVLGTTIPAGKTTTVPVTGAQIGVPSVDHGSLQATYTTTATPAQQTAGATSAHAHLDLSFSGTFYDAAGKQLYSGPIQKVRFGDVLATCENAGPTPPTSSTTPTSPTTPTTPTTTPTTPTSPTTPPTSPAPTTPTSPPGPPASTSSPRHPHHSAHTHGGGPSSPENGPMQPAGQTRTLPNTGGGPSGWWAALSVVGLGTGVLLFFATRRRGKHQH
ncbi:MAG: hypothetical protein HOW97_00800 [Catenulispora sp.]|nr:hypothetical protein [Catenulispora sp.]